MKDIEVMYWIAGDHNISVSDKGGEYRVCVPFRSIAAVSDVIMTEWERNENHVLEQVSRQPVVILFLVTDQKLRCLFPETDEGETTAMKFFEDLRANVV